MITSARKLPFLLIVLLGIGTTTNAQILIPKFDEPVKMDVINSKGEDVAPIPYMDGNMLYFVRTYVNGNSLDRKKGQEIWQSQRQNGVWGEPHGLFEEANDLGNNGVIGASKDGKKVYVFNSIQSRRTLARGISYLEKNEDGSWSELTKLEIEGLEIGEGYYSFYMNPTEDILLISKAASDTTSKEDLFVSVRDGGSWGPVTNLGSTINTDGFESSPYIAEDGKTLYFSSNGHGGLGDADIFMSYRQSESWTDWSKPVNLGAPINSPGYDAYFVLGNNREVFFASNRNGKFSDIYTTKISEETSVQPSIAVNGQFNYNGLPAENVKLEIYDGDGNLVDEVVTDAYGRFTYNKLNAEDDYVIKIAADDKMKYPDSFVYIVDNQGNKLSRLSLQEDGIYTEEAIDDSETELITGVYEYNNLPMSKAALVILDENGFPLDTFYTDNDGKFEYYKLKEDKNYTLVPLDVKDVLLENVNVYLTDDEGKKLDTDVLAKTEKKKEVAEVQKDVTKQADKKPTKDKKPAKEERKVVAHKGEIVIYFDFNEVTLTSDDKKKLDEAISVLKGNASKKVVLTGHTDNVGSESVNTRVSKMRAAAAAAYLKGKGINASRIEEAGAGESQPATSNDTADGRAKNRRVEVSYK